VSDKPKREGLPAKGRHTSLNPSTAPRSLARSPRLHVANNGLGPRMNMDVLDRDFLLALAAMAVQRLEERGVGP
jgi:hypothetical protein